MVDRIGPVNAVSSVPQYDGRWERQLRDVHQAMGSTARPVGARTGVRPGTPSSTVTATSTTWTCQGFGGYADVETLAEAGGYPFSFDAVATGAMTPADSVNPRVDIIYVQIDDPAEDGSATPAVTRKYLAGVAGSGSAPTPPVSRAFVIAQINVPKSGTGSPSVTWVAPYTAAAGALVPFNTLAQLNLWNTNVPANARATVFADPTAGNNGDYYWTGTAWKIYATIGRVSWAPVINNFTTGGGSTSVQGFYEIHNGVLFGEVRISLAALWNITGNPSIIPPVPIALFPGMALVDGDGLERGDGSLLRSGVGYYVAGLLQDGSGNLRWVAPGGSGSFWGAVTRTSPATWDNGDKFSFQFQYPV